MLNPMKILIVGGTSTMAEHCARLWLKQANCEMILLGRDENRLQRVTQDCMVVLYMLIPCEIQSAYLGNICIRSR